ncbi:MAG: methyltransferase domain-containing protein [Hyphomicrobiales bacterium]|nr:methyltransferase domain-containing protein [Hyphomicrobiales bacterium]
MTGQPKAVPETVELFDRRLVRARLQRATRAGFADFLLRRAAEDLDDRLGAITRPFPVALDLGTATDAAIDVLRRRAGTDRAIWAAPADVSPQASLVADEERLPFAEQSLNLVTSLLALQSVNDLPGTLVQIRRSLKPDGLFIGCLLGGATLKELRQALVQAESERDGGVSPRVAPFADMRDLGGLLQRAGFALPVTDIEAVTVRYGHPLSLLADLRAMGLTNALRARRRTPLRRATLMRALEIYAAAFADPDGKVRASFEMIWLSGWAPHESQQQPLRPGSAKARLADALKTVELKAGDKAGG